jgi:hypothetical protein
MIKPLRKRHLQIWMTLAFLLPIGIIAAWLAVPKPVTDRLFQPSTGIALPKITRTIKKDGFTINLRETEDRSAIQLEWINQTALTSPSALIYELRSAEDEVKEGTAALIGRIDNRGTYYFPLNADSGKKDYHFALYDIIHHHIIDRINF